MNNDIKYWVGISLFTKIGPGRFKKLYKKFETMEQVWQASAEQLQKAGLENNLIEEFIYRKNDIDLDFEMEKLDQENIKVLTINDDLYPELLKQIHNPPALLYIKGNIDNLNSKFNLAVVGTRKISNYGQQITPQVIKPLVQNGFTIVSGLALGVDALAHQITLNNQGKTIAVLGSGIDHNSIYPSSNRYLANNILDNDGTIITEFPVGMMPLKHNFPQRNRIISGLSLGTLVIEAGQRSGSIITAYNALEQNRDVFAIPGSLLNEGSIGTNKLIQNGAKLVTTHQDILDELNLQEVKSFVQNKLRLPDTEEEKKILENLSKEPVHIDQIIKKTQMPASKTSSCLSMMEMKGMVKNLGGQNYVLL